MTDSETPEGVEQERSVMVRRSFVANYEGPLEDWYRGLPTRRDLPDHYEVVDEKGYDFRWAEPRPDGLPKPAPRRHRSGLCFDNESEEMRAACAAAIGELFDASDAVIHEARHQLDGYHTDLVYADIDPRGLRDRNHMTVGSDPVHNPLQRFRVWWYLVERGPMHKPEAIENGKYSDPKKNEEHLEWLLDHGYVSRTCTGHVDAVVPPEIATLHAVELKLRDWRTALEQADRANRCDDEFLPPTRRDRYGYADYRWVALDAGAVQPALDNRDEFEEYGVGLLAVTEGGSVHKLIDARHEPRRRYTRDRAYIESQVWGRIDAGEYIETVEDVDRSTRQPGLEAFSTPETES